MKIILEGKWKNPWSHETMCADRDCLATLLVEEQDVIAPDYNDLNSFKFVCPICRRENYLKHEVLPRRVKDALNRNRRASSGGGWRD